MLLYASKPNVCRDTWLVSSVVSICVTRGSFGGAKSLDGSMEEPPAPRFLHVFSVFRSRAPAAVSTSSICNFPSFHPGKYAPREAITADADGVPQKVETIFLRIL